MAGITAMGTTFNLPNYVGELYAVTPSDTPFLSAIGGLTGGGMTTATEFEWQTYDLGDPGQNVALEGATAPTAEGRVRANVRNVLEIHHRKISVSYTKQAAVGQLATPSSAPYRGVPGEQPVTNELDWQAEQALKEIALDLNWASINGTFSNPTTNATARKTRGMLAAISTNRIAKGTAVTGLTSSTDTIAETGTALANGDKIVFTATGAATNIVAGRVYFVVSKATDSFKVATSSGGSALTLGTATGIAYTIPTGTALATSDVDDLLQLAYDNGGISEQDTALMVVNSRQKRAITKAYATAYGQTVPITEANRTVGGVSVDTVVTDFGRLGIMLDRHMPQDTLMVCSMEQIQPVFMNIPGKGVLFTEPLAKTGASDEEQMYCEFGLRYGNERAHAAMTGLAL
jgi:hypothetical protein